MTTAELLAPPGGTTDTVSPMDAPALLPREVPSNAGPSGDEPSRVRPPLHVLHPPISQLPDSFKLLQLWEGRVIRVSEDNVVALISDETDRNQPEEEVVLDIEEFEPDDLSLLKPGAVFYWSIGYAELRGRPRTRSSRIRLRRLPGWTDAEIQRAKKEGARLAQIFGSD